MSKREISGGTELPLDVLHRIDEACDCFEAAWARDPRPRLKDNLDAVEAPYRAALLRDLLAVELNARRRLGERPDPAEYLRRFPDAAPAIAAAFSSAPTQPPSDVASTGGATTTGPGATIDTDPSSGAGSRADPASTAPSGEGANGADVAVSLPGGTRVRYFGDYELIKELGRGGMGVVYKARQISLNRPVALKMIKAAALASDDELRRFQNEAEAVALLDHPQIVPILEVDNHNGQRYFTMKLIGGTSLDNKLADYVANPKAAARLLEQAAEAVHHAHQRGILHRDLKPANILVDVHGDPFVTDFGLAKRVEGDSELTHSGAIMGTPAYMAPEQASGRRGAVTTASDVYGLGAVLYALLTGRAPFVGESVMETIDQVRDRAPEPPSRHNGRVSRELEVICLKCLEKVPGRRYSSAQALADDLRHYLAGEPITAQPVGAAMRAWMWCERNPTLAGLAASLVLALLAGLVGVTTQWWRAESHLKEAVYQRGLAEDNLSRELEAHRKLLVAKDHEARAHRLAEIRFDEAMKAIGHFGQLTNDPALMRDPKLEGLRGRLLKMALGFYREIQASLEEDASPEARAQLSEAYDRIANISWELGLSDEALATYRRAFSLVEQLAADAPSSPDRRAALARCLTRIAFTLRTRFSPVEALQPYQQAQEIQQRLTVECPAEPRYQEALSWTLTNIGAIHQDLGRPADAICFHRQAIEIHENLVRQYPTRAPYRSDLAWCWRYLSMAMVAAGDMKSALPLAEQAASLHEELVAIHRNDAELRWRLARCLDVVGRIRSRSGRPADAAVPLERSAELYESVAPDNPVLYRLDLARNQLNIAYHRAVTGRPEEATARIRKAEDLLERSSFVWPVLFYDLACIYSLCSMETPRGHFTLAERTAYSDRAIAALRRAIAAGYRDIDEIRRDPAINPLRSRADFQALFLDLSFPADPFIR
jgi:serine/threonine-protein kinase